MSKLGVGINGMICYLASSLASGGSETTVYLSTIKSLTGETMTTADFAIFGRGTLTIDPLSTNSVEYATFTAVDGTNIAVTGVNRNASSDSTGNATQTAPYHPVGTLCIISFGVQNLVDLVNYVATVVTGTTGTATNLVAGSSKLSVAAASPSNPIVVGQNDPILFQPGMIIGYGTASAPTGWLLCDGSAVSRSTYANLFTVISTTWGSGDGSTTFNVPDYRSRLLVGSGTGTKVATFASRSSNVITVTGLSNVANNEFQTGQAVTYHTTSGVMTGLTNDTVYYVVRTGNLTFSLATTLGNAQNASVISLSSDGSGTQTFTLALTARTLGNTGGEENHAMSLTELLGHTHPYIVNGNGSSGAYPAGTQVVGLTPVNTSSVGGNAAMNIMNPFGTANYIIKT